MGIQVTSSAQIQVLYDEPNVRCLVCRCRTGLEFTIYGYSMTQESSTKHHTLGYTRIQEAVSNGYNPLRRSTSFLFPTIISHQHRWIPLLCVENTKSASKPVY